MNKVTTDFDGQSVTVMGLGSFGGGLGVAQFLHSRGARVTISDRRTAEELADTLTRLPSTDQIRLHLGEHQESDFLDADLIVVNPAIRPDHSLVERARQRGIRVTSEIALFWERCRGRLAGVTGTNGKSTTTQLLHHLLQTGGRRAWRGGNIGGSLLADVDRISPEDWVVLELSSFQLSSLDEVRVSPELAVVTNFAPNHLDWHGSLEAYRHAKQTILRWQRDEDVAIVGSNGEVSHWATVGRKFDFHRDHLAGRLLSSVSAALRSPHQQENAAAAVMAARSLGVGDAAIQEGLNSFVGLPHRLQLLGTRHGRTWIDDSAATTPESTLAALASFEAPIILLVGGADKGVDLAALADGIVTSARAAVLMGSVAPHLQELIDDRLSTASLPGVRRLTSVTVGDSFQTAVSQAGALSVPGDVVLLSPGCASYGWFANYIERGNEFARLFRSGGM